MNTKYKTSTNFSKDNYNKLSPSVIVSLYKSLKPDIPFSTCCCTFIYKIDNAICTCDVNNIPKNLFLPSAEYLILDFVSDKYDSVSVTLMPDSISVSASLPYDYQNTKVFAEDFFKLTVKIINKSDNNKNTGKKQTDIFKRFLDKIASVIVFLIKLIKAIL